LQFRLVSNELVALYDSGRLANVPPSVARSFFGLLEAVESAVDLRDLAALRSLGMSKSGDRLHFALADGFVCPAVLVTDDGRVTGMEFADVPHKP
jgi:hypothetical protein